MEVLINPVELAKFAEKHGWIAIEKSDEEDEKLGDDYLVYLTPQGNQVVVRFDEDNEIQKIR